MSKSGHVPSACSARGRAGKEAARRAGVRAGGKWSLRCRAPVADGPRETARERKDGRRLCRAEGQVEAGRMSGQVFSSNFTCLSTRAWPKVGWKREGLMSSNARQLHTSPQSYLIRTEGVDLPSFSSGLTVTSLRTSMPNVDYPPPTSAHERQQNASFKTAAGQKQAGEGCRRLE